MLVSPWNGSMASTRWRGSRFRKVEKPAPEWRGGPGITGWASGAPEPGKLLGGYTAPVTDRVEVPGLVTAVGGAGVGGGAAGPALPIGAGRVAVDVLGPHAVGVRGPATDVGPARVGL